MITFAARAAFLHVGARGRVTGGEGPGLAEVVFSDGARASGYLIGDVLHVDAHLNGEGARVPEKSWDVWIELGRFRVNRRVARGL